MKKNYVYQFIMIFFSFSAIAQTVPVWKTKVDPVVLRKAEMSPSVEYVVVMKQQADVSAADKLETKEQKGEFVYKALRAAAEHSQGEVLSLLSKTSATYQSFWMVNMITVTSDLSTLQAIAELASVENIIENGKYVVSKTTETVVAARENQSNTPAAPMAGTWGIQKTKADQVWSQYNVKGAGVVVAGEDTGYQWDHPAIKSKYRGWNGSSADHNYNWHDAVHATGSSCGADSPSPCDDHGHGTHTMGTMVGGTLSSGYDIGMAPDAKWIGCRNMNANDGTLTTYVECFQFFLAPTDMNDKNQDTKKAPHVVNNSWGCPTSEGCNSSNFATMEKAVTNLRAAGVVVVVSAGNDGSKGCSSINTPAPIFVGSFTVGATDSGDDIASFSSLGPVTNYGPSHVSPDISAPGVGVLSAWPKDSSKSEGGTSMAGPHVAGLVALIISANPQLAGNVKTIEDIIQSTAVKLYSSSCGSGASAIPNNTFGYGRIDALAAVKKALDMVSVSENEKNNGVVNAFPNPFTNTISFELKNWNAGTTLEIYSITGSIIFSKTWEAIPSKYQVELANQASGVYFYKISNSTQSANGKLFKVND